MHTGIGGRGLVGWEEYLGRNRRAAFCLRVISSLHAARPRLSQAFVPASMHEDGGGCCWDLLESLASSLGSTAFPREDNIPVLGSRSVPFKTPSALLLSAQTLQSEAGAKDLSAPCGHVPTPSATIHYKT